MALWNMALFLITTFSVLEGKHTLVFLSGEFHGQRSLAGYSPWGRKELDMTEQHIHFLSSRSSQKEQKI